MELIRRRKPPLENTLHYTAQYIDVPHAPKNNPIENSGM